MLGLASDILVADLVGQKHLTNNIKGLFTKCLPGHLPYRMNIARVEILPSKNYDKGG